MWELKPLEENIGRNLDLWLGNDFLDIAKAQAT